MDRLPQRAAVTAALVSLTLSLAACGGGSASAGTTPPAATPPGPAAQAVDGITTPNSVSVVTAKNAN
jgi:hypothetical protein